jgi:hypothetical protein
MNHLEEGRAMNNPNTTPEAARAVAEQFVEDNLVQLCRELVAFGESGLFGIGQAHELRTLCSFAGTAAQSLAINLVHTAALRSVAAR